MTGFTPEQYGATGGPDDSAAVQAAGDAARSAGSHVVLSKLYNASIVWRRGYDFRGSGLGENGRPGSGLSGIPGTPTLTWDNTTTVNGSSLVKLQLLSKDAPVLFKDHPHSQPSGLTVDWCTLTGNTSSGAHAPAVHILGGMSDVTFRETQIWGNPYGLDVGIPPGYGSALDWWTFENCIIGGEKTGLRWRTSNAGGGAWKFERVRFGGGSEHTIILKGNAKEWIWDRCAAAEAQGGGVWATGSTWTGTATAAKGSTSATVNSVSALSLGDLLTVRGGGVIGDPYEGTIMVIDIAAKVVTLDKPFGKAVMAAECTNARWDIIHVPTDADEPDYPGFPAQHTFIATGFGRGAGSNIRYSVGGGSKHTFIDWNGFGAPVLDKFGTAVWVNSTPQDGPVWTSDVWQYATIPRKGTQRWDAKTGRPVWTNGTDWVYSDGSKMTP